MESPPTEIPKLQQDAALSSWLSLTLLGVWELDQTISRDPLQLPVAGEKGRNIISQLEKLLQVMPF